MYFFVFSIPLFLFIYAFYVQKVSGSWLAPGVFFVLFWFLWIILPIVFAPEYPVSVFALLVLTFFVIVFSVSSIVGEQLGNKSKVKNKPLTLNKKYIVFLLVISIILGWVYSTISMFDSGISLKDFFTLEGWFSVTSFLSNRRYKDYEPPFYHQMFLPFTFLSPLLGGTLYRLNISKRSWIWIILSLSPGVLMTIVGTEKAATLLSIAFFLSTYLSFGILTGNNQLFSTKNVRYFGFLFISVVILTITATIARVGGEDDDIYLLLTEKLKISIFGHLSVFSNWFDNYSWQNLTNSTNGFYTFAGIFKLTGIKNREGGLYDDFFFFPNGESSNIFTAFRGLISDFTIVGTFFYLIIIGLFIGFAYSKIAKGHVFFLWAISLFYGWTMMSLIASLFIWNSTVFAYLLFLIILYSGKFSFKK